MIKQDIIIPQEVKQLTYLGIPVYKLLCNCESITLLEYQLYLTEIKTYSKEKLSILGQSLLSEILKIQMLLITYQNISDKADSFGEWCDIRFKSEKNTHKIVDTLLTNQDIDGIYKWINKINLQYLIC